ncbi:hypothetical protein P280DRAFT_313842 [Massarina eburnea CBS 473.64]|uniref:SnoaL-like domain-containing protein n=1 Tax=Massarina eburnea CBS 473.64 TaxID=1395130 RepID=A0A6A6S0U8_9PLEO|nr:hypothetical protein P280DRAFT_313842 [Massarina eburnea CBS 473.64]
MSNDKADLYRNKLDRLYAIIQQLRPDSSPQDFEAFASYFTTDCLVYLKSMNLHSLPGISRQEAIEDMKDILGKIHIEKREVLLFALTSDEYTVLCEMKQRINVMGEIIDPFFETAVVTFDEEGLIKVFKIYNCWSPIVRIVQDKTGLGPYGEGEKWKNFEAHLEKTANARIRKRKETTGEGLNKGCCT